MRISNSRTRFLRRQFDTLFLGVKAEDEINLTKTDHPFGWLLTVIQKEHAKKEEIAEALSRAVEHINRLPEAELHQWRRVIFFLYLLIFHRRPPEEHDDLKAIVYQQIEESLRKEEGEKMAETMAEYLIEQGEKRGEKRGKLQTKREYILNLLQLRFNDVPEWAAKQIRSIRSLKQLDEIFRQAATAKTLDEIKID